MSGVVNLKGRNKGLELAYSTATDFSDVLVELEKKLEVAQEFFRGSDKPVSIFLPKGYNLSPEYTEALLELVTRYNLIYSPPALPEVVEETAASTVAEAEIFDVKDVLEINSEKLSLIKTGNEDPNSMDKWSLESENCLIVYKTLRGGQEISYCGTIIIVGDVNPTARVFAEGDIVVSGVSRGYLHAGVFGNVQANIMAKDFLGGQLRIAHCIAAAPENGEVSRFPQRAMISNGSIEVRMLENGGK